jgi:hypothetical protein
MPTREIARIVGAQIGAVLGVMRVAGLVRAKARRELSLAVPEKVYAQLESSAVHRSMSVESVAAGLLSGVIARGCISKTLAGYNEGAADHIDRHGAEQERRRQRRARRRKTV